MKSEEDKIMKKSIAIVGIVLMALLPALMGAAQAGAVEYQSTYRGVQAEPVHGIGTTATPPNTTFQSTSAYSGQWNNETSATLLNSDGSVNADIYGVGKTASGPRRSPGTPGGNPDEGDQQPLGEGLLALMMMAGAYALARRKNERVSE